MSELVSEGHVDAPDYPIAFVWEEVQLVAERKNRRLASEGTILQAAINTGIAAFGKDGGAKAHGAFKRLINTLTGESDDPAAPPPPPSKRRRGS